MHCGDSPVASAAEGVGTRTEPILSPNTSVTTTVPEEEPEPTADNEATGEGGKQDSVSKGDAEQKVDTGTTQKSIFKQTMSVADVVKKIEAFTGSTALCQTMCIAGTHSSNKRGGAMSEVALTRREKRQKQMEKSTNQDTPPNWDPTSTVAPGQQCPRKPRGRKPKEGKGTDSSPKAAKTKAAAKKKGQPKAAAKARSKTAKPKAKLDDVEPAQPKSRKRKNTKAATKAGKGDDKAADDKKAETKKRISRKSAAYHGAFRAAKNEGKDLEACKAAAKKVLQLHIEQI